MKRILISIVTIIGVSSVIALHALKVHPPQKPNIVIMILDDAEMQDLGIYGGIIDTPNMDQLGTNGKIFTNAYTHSICTPSRAALMTGRYANCVGLSELSRIVTSHPAQLGHINLSVQTISEWLLGQGYNTFMSGKWHVGINNHPAQPFEVPPYASGFQPLDRGFENYVGLLTGLTSYYETGVNRWRRNDVLVNRPTGFYATDWLGDEAANFIDTLSTGKPFYLYFAPTAPHTPYQPPTDGTVQKYSIRYSNLDSLTQICEQTQDRYEELGIISCKTLESSSSPHEISQLANPSTLQRYAIRSAMIESIDIQVGKIMQSLINKQELDNTIIMLVTDNGGEQYALSAMFDNCPLNGRKRGIQEGGIHNPFLVHWPNEISPGVSHQLTHLIDIFPTIQDIVAGFQTPDKDGISLKNNLTHDQVFDRCLTTETYDRTAIICSDLWKLHVDNNFDPHRSNLYNLKCDRSESTPVNADLIIDSLHMLYLDYAEACNTINGDSIAYLADCYPNCDSVEGLRAVDEMNLITDRSGLNKDYYAEMIDEETVILYEYRIQGDVNLKDLKIESQIELNNEDLDLYFDMSKSLDKNQSVYIRKVKYEII